MVTPPGRFGALQETNITVSMPEFRDKAHEFAGLGDPEQKPWGLLEGANMDPFYNRPVLFADPS